MPAASTATSPDLHYVGCIEGSYVGTNTQHRARVLMQMKTEQLERVLQDICSLGRTRICRADARLPTEYAEGFLQWSTCHDAGTREGQLTHT